VDIHSQLCEVYGENCMSVQHLRKWCREFKDGRTDFHDEQHSGRPSVLDETDACQYNNQCGPLLWDVEEPSPRDSKQEERHAHEGSAFPSGQRSSAHRPCNNRSINKFGWDTVTHPPYSPDIAPSDYHLFPELKKHLGGTHFRTGDELKEEVLSYLHSAAGEFYNSGIKKMVHRMQKCIIQCQ
jgi:histone-lysine N-methyltransferase SETMAR